MQAGLHRIDKQQGLAVMYRELYSIACDLQLPGRGSNLDVHR